MAQPLLFPVTGTSLTPHKDVYERYAESLTITKEEAEKHKIICDSCPHLQKDSCTNKDCGCQLSDQRVQPWRKLKRCPDLQW